MGGIIQNPLKDWSKERVREINQIIDLEPEIDLEFKVWEFRFGDPLDPDNKFDHLERREILETILSDGWQLDDKIVCSPFVMLIFSREKEEVKE